MKHVEERCDCCGAIVAETSFKGDTERIYRRRVRLFEWITGSWLGWRLIEGDWQTLCGECWDAIGKAVAESRALADSGEASGEAPEKPPPVLPPLKPDYIERRPWKPKWRRAR